jgi:cell division protein FtsA
MFRNKNIITAFDIGSHSIKGLVAQKRAEGEKLGVLTHFNLSSEGLRRGVVIDSESCSESVKKTALRLKAIAKPHQLADVFVNINGSHINGEEAYGAVAISKADHKVSREDINRVIAEAKNINLPINQEALDIFPREFIVDGQAGLIDIEGIKGIKLEVRGLAVSAFSLYIKKLMDSVIDADLSVGEIFASPLAASRAVLNTRQKELGVAMIDIGAETTGIAVFEEKHLIHLVVLPVGSANITRDIAVALQTDIEIAEEIKKNFGGYIFKSKRKKEKIKLNEEEVFEFDPKKVMKAGRARVSEILGLIEKELKKIHKQKALPAGIVLTGGGSQLTGLLDSCKKQLQLPVRKGTCEDFIGLDTDPSLSVVLGLALLGSEEVAGTPPKNHILNSIIKFLKNLTP